MKCPVCGAWSTVKETRDSKQFGFRRRRECANEHKFTTQEVVIPDEVIEEDDERILQLVEKNAWWPFDRVDGRLLAKLHKQQSTTTYEEAPI